MALSAESSGFGMRRMPEDAEGQSRASPGCITLTSDSSASRSSQTLPPPPPRRPLTANGNVQGTLPHQARRGHERHTQHLENKALYEVGSGHPHTKPKLLA